MANDIDLLSLLPYIPPDELNYQEWISVGMALKEGGYTASDWDDWSRSDIGRYHPGECERKWASFQGCPTPVTGGTLVQMAKEHGWHPGGHDDGPGYELDWDSIIGTRDGVLVDRGWLEGKDVHEPSDWNPVAELTKYLETLFDASENVGYASDTDNDESALEAWLDGLLADMPPLSSMQIAWNCYPAVTGNAVFATLSKYTSDNYAVVFGASYNGSVYLKRKFNTWQAAQKGEIG